MKSGEISVLFVKLRLVIVKNGESWRKVATISVLLMKVCVVLMKFSLILEKIDILLVF